MTGTTDTLLLHLPAPLYKRADQFLLDDQACNGLRLWADHFGRLLVLCIVEEGSAPGSWVPLDRIGPALDRIEFVHLPSAWRPDKFLRALPATRRTIRAALGQVDLVGTTLGGASFGDWGAVIAREACKMGLPFYIWTDRVEPEVIRHNARSASVLRRARIACEYPIMCRLERNLIARADLGLFHGRDTYDAYAPFCKNPQLVHDVHIDKADHVSPALLADKQAHTGPLRIVYAGRADRMKGSDDWLDVLLALQRRKVPFHAQWLGDGPELQAMRARVAAGPLAGHVNLPGFISDRSHLQAALQQSDVLLFCHQTPESPRILIEALASGCPLIGYESAYPADLLSPHGGGILVPKGQIEGLAQVLADLSQDRGKLSDLISRAARAGAEFDDETVFAHRAAIIRANLPRARQIASRA